jgi:hypothetical protein
MTRILARIALVRSFEHRLDKLLRESVLAEVAFDAGKTRVGVTIG